MGYPKLEGLFRVDTAWTMNVTEDGAAATVTVLPAGDYYWTSHNTSTSAACTTIGNALTANGTLADTYTVTLVDDLDTDNGFFRISVGAGDDFYFSWAAGSPDPATTTGLANVAVGDKGVTLTGTSQAQYLWLPNCGRAPGLLSPDGQSGTWEEDFTQVVAPSGRVKTLYYGSGRQVDVLGFGQIRGNKARAAYETTTNQSLETFWKSVIRHGYPLRYHPSRATDATYVTWVAEAGAMFECPPMIPDWDSASAMYSWSSRVRKYV